jgi:hypothetical protein
MLLRSVTMTRAVYLQPALYWKLENVSSGMCSWRIDPQDVHTCQLVWM